MARTARETDLKKTSSTDVICIQKPLPPPFNRHWQNTHFLLWSSHRSLTIWFPNLNHDPYSKTPPSQNLSLQFPPFKQRSTTPLTPSSCHYRFLNPLFEILHTPPMSIIDALPYHVNGDHRLLMPPIGICHLWWYIKYRIEFCNLMIYTFFAFLINYDMFC